MLAERTIQNPRYMIEIYSFFSIIITKYLVRDPVCPELLQVAGNIFNWDKNLHADVLPKYAADELKYYHLRDVLWQIVLTDLIRECINHRLIERLPYKRSQ